MTDVAVIGGGLCGLILAERLRAEGRDVRVYEARERPGGRVLTVGDRTRTLDVDLGLA